MKRRLVLLGIALMSLLSVGMIYAQDECAEPEQCAAVERKYGVSADVIAAYPEPNVTWQTVDSDLLNDRWYMQINDAVNFHDAPGGNVTASMPAGFNFVTVYSQNGDWVEINPGQWVLASALETSNTIISQFTGVFLPAEGLPYPMSWALVNMYPSQTPGGEPYEAYDLVWRYTRLNIYAVEVVDGFQWYQIGVDQWVHQYNVGKIIPAAKPAEVTTDKWISIDLFEQVMIAYEGDTPVFATLIASGLPRWETVEGVFNIYYRRTRIEMSAGTPGDDFYYLEEVPWTMFFDEGRALHGAYWHDGFGFRRSHGCVNLSLTDAKWLYDWVAEEFEKYNSPDVEEGGPAVYVYHSQDYR